MWEDFSIVWRSQQWPWQQHRPSSPKPRPLPRARCQVDAFPLCLSHCSGRKPAPAGAPSCAGMTHRDPSAWALGQRRKKGPSNERRSEPSERLFLPRVGEAAEISQSPAGAQARARRCLPRHREGEVEREREVHGPFCSSRGESGRACRRGPC